MDTPAQPTSSPQAVSNTARGLSPEGKFLPGHSVGASTRWRKGEAGELKKRNYKLTTWSLPVLKKLSRYYPDAVQAIGLMVKNPEHKEHWNACKLVVESLVREEKVPRSMAEGGSINIKVELADTARVERPVIEVLPDLPKVKVPEVSVVPAEGQ